MATKAYLRALELARDALVDADIGVDTVRRALDVAERERDRAARHLENLIAIADEKPGVCGPEAA